MGIEYCFTQIFFHHKIFLNGKQILLNKRCIENIRSILNDSHFTNEEEFFELTKLKIIRKIYEGVIPEDSVFLLDDREVTQEEENELKIFDFFPEEKLDPTPYNRCYKINIFSRRLYLEKEIKSSFKVSGFKILEKNEKFSLIEYPETKEEKGKEYFSILIFGSKIGNLLFINGFLNFLFDIKDNDPYRFKLESSDYDNYYEDYSVPIDTKFIHTEKGNFKFNCVNIREDWEFSDDDVKLLIDFFNKEKNINIIAINMNNSLFFNDNLDLIDKIMNSYEHELYDIFFVCPNYIHSHLKFSFLQKKFGLKDKLNAIHHISKKNYLNEKLIKDTILHVAEADENLREYLISSSFDFESIYNENKSKNALFSYNLTMESYSYFYNILNKRKQKFVDLSFFISDNFNEIRKSYDLYIIKQKKLELEKLKLKLDNEKNKKEEISKYLKEIKNIKELIKDDIKINTLKIPNNSEKIIFKESDKMKTNVCHLCKFNCHIKCKDSNTASCKSFKLKTNKCKFCPNKCPLEYHEIVNYKYINSKYEEYDEILKEKINRIILKLKYEELGDPNELTIEEEQLKMVENKKFNNQRLKWTDELLLIIFNYKAFRIRFCWPSH